MENLTPYQNKFQFEQKFKCKIEFMNLLEEIFGALKKYFIIKILDIRNVKKIIPLYTPPRFCS